MESWNEVVKDDIFENLPILKKIMTTLFSGDWVGVSVSTANLLPSSQTIWSQMHLTGISSTGPLFISGRGHSEWKGSSIPFAITVEDISAAALPNTGESTLQRINFTLIKTHVGQYTNSVAYSCSLKMVPLSELNRFISHYKSSSDYEDLTTSKEQLLSREVDAKVGRGITVGGRSADKGSSSSSVGKEELIVAEEEEEDFDNNENSTVCCIIGKGALGQVRLFKLSEQTAPIWETWLIKRENFALLSDTIPPSSSKTQSSSSSSSSSTSSSSSSSSSSEAASAPTLSPLPLVLVSIETTEPLLQSSSSPFTPHMLHTYDTDNIAVISKASSSSLSVVEKEKEALANLKYESIIRYRLLLSGYLLGFGGIGVGVGMAEVPGPLESPYIRGILQRFRNAEGVSEKVHLEVCLSLGLAVEGADSSPASTISSTSTSAGESFSASALIASSSASATATAAAVAAAVDRDLCRICYSRPMDCLLMPCAHLAVCHECGEKMKLCPFDRIKIESIQIFLRVV